MRRVFGELIWRIIEAYIDDIVVKSRKTGDLVADLTEVFAKLRQHGVKLNPENCIFGVPRGMLLGFVVSEHGIEANPEKISAIMDMGPIKNLKGVQRVTGCLTALSRFIARFRERSLLLYKMVKRSDHFLWTPRCKKRSTPSRTCSRARRSSQLRHMKGRCSCASLRQPRWSAPLSVRKVVLTLTSNKH
jgi:hypothetical protein